MRSQKMPNPSNEYWTLSDVEKLMKLMGENDVLYIDLHGMKISKAPAMPTLTGPEDEGKELTDDQLLYGQDFDEEGDK